MILLTILLVITAGVGFFVAGYVYGLIAGVDKCQKLYEKWMV